MSSPLENLCLEILRPHLFALYDAYRGSIEIGVYLHEHRQNSAGEYPFL